MSDPADLSLAAAASAIARKDLSATELLDANLRRVERLEPVVRAFVTLDAESAQARARELTDGELQGPLHGIPVGIKDLIDVAGLPTTASSRVLAGNIAAGDAPVVRDVRRAGAVIVGKTNTQEFAYGVVSAPTRNPWDLERIPGGSSGGSAAAVAAGMCPGALGSDTAGSVRIPSSLCGITGLTPRQRLVRAYVAGPDRDGPRFSTRGAAHGYSFLGLHPSRCRGPRGGGRGSRNLVSECSTFLGDASGVR
jgi:aspartyl-tRNA(Asn)/glutamyl-tRNA(Gln) amidotransferase subunit A